MKKGAFISFLVYFIFGLYFLNLSLEFVILPEFISKLDKWLILIGSFLIIFGAINYFRLSKIKKIKIN